MLRIHELRQKTTLKQEELAELLKVDRSTVTKWESGENSPHSDMLPLIAKALHCSIEDLFMSVDVNKNHLE